MINNPRYSHSAPVLDSLDQGPTDKHPESMNPPKEITFTIRAPIAALPNLTLIERVALANIGEHPGCSNAPLAKLLGISVRGVEDLLRRLRDSGLIRQIGKGRARQLNLTFPVEQHISRGQSENSVSHIECGVAATAMAVAIPEPSTKDFVTLHLSLYETCLEFGEYEHARKKLELARNRLEADTEIPIDQKSKLLQALKFQEDRCFAFKIGSEMTACLPASEQHELALTLCRASAEKMAMFRERVEAGALLNNSDGVRALIDA